MESLTTYTLAIFALFGLAAIVSKLSKFWIETSIEAEKKEKKIEYGLFILTALALVVSILGIFYNANRVDNLEDKLEGLETRYEDLIIEQTP